MTEINCDSCGAYSDSPNAKAVCIHCFRKVLKERNNYVKEINKLRKDFAKRVERLRKKLNKIECENVVDGIIDEIFGDDALEGVSE